MLDLENFHYKHPPAFHIYVTIEQNNASVANTKSCKSDDLQNGHGESITCALPQGLDLQLQGAMSINAFELQAKMLGFQLRIEKWVDSRVIVYTESIIAFSKL